MKKLSIILISFLILFSACNNNTEKKENAVITKTSEFHKIDTLSWNIIEIIQIDTTTYFIHLYGYNLGRNSMSTRKYYLNSEGDTISFNPERKLKIQILGQVRSHNQILPGIYYPGYIQAIFKYEDYEKGIGRTWIGPLEGTFSQGISCRVKIIK
ncbi:MAG: hypothetical protein U9Q99_02495 [Nanoarchaeota archaeon]|nr:hypothetical protein [Nanoarchaeota archaeon]